VAGVPPAWVDLAADTAASTVLLAEPDAMSARLAHALIAGRQALIAAVWDRLFLVILFKTDKRRR